MILTGIEQYCSILPRHPLLEFLFNKNTEIQTRKREEKNEQALFWQACVDRARVQSR
jgi:hypothetical protein